MFTNLLFIIFVLLLISLKPEKTALLVRSPVSAFGIGLVVYFSILVIIGLQNALFRKYLHRIKASLLILANSELVIFLCIYLFVLRGPRFYEELEGHKFQSINYLFSLLFYFGGLWFFHYTYIKISKPHTTQSATEYASRELRMVVPFAIPFLIFSLVVDLLQFLPQRYFSDDSNWTVFFILGVLVLMLLVMAFLPFVIQWIWQCRPIQNPLLKTRLENLCQKAHFKHAGMKTWSVLNHSLTAAIVGVVPQFRYVMFTPKLMEKLSPDAIEAILAHEIGHSYRKHLLLYPLIFFGMLFFAGLFSTFTSAYIEKWIQNSTFFHSIESWGLVEPLAIFIPYVIVIGLYFRFIFGYFSRLFERQADLHVFNLDLPPENMIEALNEIAYLSGNTHKQPSWHHYSIEQRIEFLNAVIKDPELIESHHRKVRLNVWFYCIALFMIIGILGLFF